VLPILVYVCLVLSASNIIIKKVLGYNDMFYFRDHLRTDLFYPISVFGIGLLNVLTWLPVTLLLLPVAFYWFVFNIWKTIYTKFIAIYLF